MTIVIDELSNEVLTDEEINGRVAALIESVYSIGREQMITRLAIASPSDQIAQANFATYHATVEGFRDAGKAAKAAAAIVRGAIAYEQAQNRLAQYQLSVGAPERTIIVLTGAQELDPLTGLMVDVTEVQVIPAIDALPAFIDSVDEFGVVTQVPNPLIVEDDAERSAANAVISSASQQIIDMVANRSTAK